MLLSGLRLSQNSFKQNSDEGNSAINSLMLVLVQQKEELKKHQLGFK